MACKPGAALAGCSQLRSSPQSLTCCPRRHMYHTHATPHASFADVPSPSCMAGASAAHQHSPKKYPTHSAHHAIKPPTSPMGNLWTAAAERWIWVYASSLRPMFVSPGPTRLLPFPGPAFMQLLTNNDEQLPHFAHPHPPGPTSLTVSLRTCAHILVTPYVCIAHNRSCVALPKGTTQAWRPDQLCAYESLLTCRALPSCRGVKDACCAAMSAAPLGSEVTCSNCFTDSYSPPLHAGGQLPLRHS